MKVRISSQSLLLGNIARIGLSAGCEHMAGKKWMIGNMSEGWGKFFPTSTRAGLLGQGY